METNWLNDFRKLMWTSSACFPPGDKSGKRRVDSPPSVCRPGSRSVSCVQAQHLFPITVQGTQRKVSGLLLQNQCARRPDQDLHELTRSDGVPDDEAWRVPGCSIHLQSKWDRLFPPEHRLQSKHSCIVRVTFSLILSVNNYKTRVLTFVSLPQWKLRLQ